MPRTNIHIYILLINLWLLPLVMTAQTPYDSFAPEATRPMLCTPAERWMQKVLLDSVTYTITVDLQNRTLYLINEQTDSLVAIVQVDQNNVMWLSVDPLADKNIYSSPYAYCIGNPIRLIDPDGMAWTDADGNIIQDHSQIKAYIFYNKEAFGTQTMKMYSDLEAKYGKGCVALSDVTTTKEFQQDWQDMAGTNIQEININHHGSNQAIHLDSQNKQYVTSTGDGLTNVLRNEALNVQDLSSPMGNILNARLNLNTCKSNSTTQHPLMGSGLTLMQAFFIVFEFKEVRGTTAGVSYNRSTLTPEPQFFWQSWDYLRR